MEIGFIPLVILIGFAFLLINARPPAPAAPPPVVYVYSEPPEQAVASVGCLPLIGLVVMISLLLVLLLG